MQIQQQLSIGSTQTIRVVERTVMDDPNSEILEDHTVIVDLATSTLKCSCHYYENWWILCRHMLRVMDGLGTFGNLVFMKIPQCYIKKRWTKDCKKVGVINSIASDVAGNPETSEARHQQMCSIVLGSLPSITKHKAAYDLILSRYLKAVKEANSHIAADTENSQPTVDQEGSNSKYDIKHVHFPVFLY